MSDLNSCLTCSSDTCINKFEEFKKNFSSQKEFKYNFEEHSLPITMMLSLTDNCNLSCPYCFVKQKPNYMTFEIAEQALQYLKNNCKKRGMDLTVNKPPVNFFGGEPLLCYDTIIKPLVEKYHNDFSFGITTNGVLLNEDIVDFFYKYNVQILFSFDGVEEVQNIQRPGKNFDSFQKILNNIPYLLLRFPHVTMRATLTKHSIPYILDTVLMAEDLGFKNVTFCPNAFEDWDEIDENKLTEQFLKVGLHIYKKLYKTEEYPVIAINPLVKGVATITSAINGVFGYNNTIMRCGLGTNTCAITPTGDIVPCQEKTSSPTVVLGNIYTGINSKIHEEFLNNYFNSINKVTCDKNCSNKARLLCASNICPSRMEDLNYRISSAECIFHKVTAKVASRLHLLCADSFNPYIRSYFSEGEIYIC